jgi:chemotaxis protein MotB
MSKKQRARRRPLGGAPEHAEHGEHSSNERWLVTYADMITLLMVLFIVMFSMSAVDSKKFAQLASALSASFGGHSVALSGFASPIDGHPDNVAVIADDPGADPQLSRQVQEAMTVKKDAPTGTEGRAHASVDARAAEVEVKNLREVQRKITAALKARHLEDSVRFHFDERGLVVTVVTSAVIFAGDRAELLTDGRAIVDAVAPALRPLPNKVQVDGHTNQLPVPTIIYPSAWELSTARAAAVVRRLDVDGVAKKRLAAAGFADTRPLLPPTDPRSVTMNRRVDIVVLSTLPPQQASLLPSAAG